MSDSEFIPNPKGPLQATALWRRLWEINAAPFAPDIALNMLKHPEWSVIVVVHKPNATSCGCYTPESTFADVLRNLTKPTTDNQ